MSYWANRLKSLSVNENLAELEAKLNDEACTAESPEYLAKIVKCRRAVAFIRQCIDTVDAEYASFPLLETIDKQVQEFKNQIINFISNNNLAHVDNALAQAENLFTNGGYLLAPVKFSNAETVIQNKNSLVDTAERSIEKISNQSGIAIAKAKNVSEGLESLKLEVEEFKSDISETKDNFNSTIQNLKDELADYIRSSKDEHSENERSAKESLSEVVIQMQKTLSDSSNEFNERAEKKIGQLSEQLEQAQRIVGATANTGLTGHYQKMAVQESERANDQRRIAYTLMAVMLGLAMWVLFKFDSTDWALTLIKLVGIAIFSFPAGYAIKESAKHRAYERVYRRLELELAALGPFLEQMPDVDKHELKKQLSEKYFGQNDISGEATSEYKSLLDRLLNVIEKLSKK